MAMNIRAFVLSAGACTVLACLVAPAAVADPSGDNTYQGRQSGHVSGDGDSSGSAVINDAPAGDGSAPSLSDSSVDEKIGSAIGAMTFRARITVRRSESVQELRTTSDEPIVRSTRFAQWRRGWPIATAPDEVSSPVITHHHRIESALVGEVRPVHAPAVVASDPALAAAETHTTIGRQTGSLTGPPGPVGPAAPEESGPVRVAPIAPSVTPAPAAPAPAPVATHAPAPVRRELPLNGVESARMAKLAAVLMLVGFGLMALARCIRPRVRVVKPV
jgi:hypothetical protein